jgi:hypothetical protein
MSVGMLATLNLSAAGLLVDVYLSTFILPAYSSAISWTME